MSSVVYRLLDFGNGRKLESLGDFVIDRPSPAAETARPNLANWSHADARFDSTTKRWHGRKRTGSRSTVTPDPASGVRPSEKSWMVDCGRFLMPTRLTPFGHLGIFPEQADNWNWLSAIDVGGVDIDGGRCVNALNLFGYTGAATMALVAAGFHVAHVDAAKPNVAAARAAAQLNRWQDHPIRYLVDDAVKFAAREVRREREYHTIVMDPPAYGHDPKGRAWRLQRDLWPLLDDALRLLAKTGGRLLITGHTESVTQSMVQDYLKTNGPSVRGDLKWKDARYRIGRSSLESKDGRRLDAGFFVRFEIDGDCVDAP